jgi:hypothetical protein
LPLEPELAELFVRTISVEPWASEDSGGKPTYGTAVDYDCAIADDVKMWKWENGQEKQSRTTIYIDGETITLKDRITLPSGYTPRIVFPIYMLRFDDDEGYHHSEIYL